MLGNYCLHKYASDLICIFHFSLFQNTMIEQCRSFATVKEKAWAGHLTGPAETANGEAIQETWVVLGQGCGLVTLMETLL